MTRVAVWILHREPGPSAGPLERSLAVPRRALAARHATWFRAAGADEVAVVAGPPDDTPFGARIRALLSESRPDGVVVLGSGAIALATAGDIRAFVDAARRQEPIALANNRYSADIVAVACARRLAGLPDLEADNALPRWLEEVAGYEVRDLRGRWRLGLDLDSPLDAAIVGMTPDAPTAVAHDRLAAVASIANDRRAEVVVAGRTSASTLAWLEEHVPARIRALVEERGLRAASRLARSGVGRADDRPPRSVLGLLLDRDGPHALGAILAELGDAAVVDTRVLLAHRLGADERRWPVPEDRFASDLLLADAVADPWLRSVTAAAASAPIPVALGGHTLLGPGLRLVLRHRNG